MQESRFIKISPEILLTTYEGFFFIFPVSPEHSAPHLDLDPELLSRCTVVSNGGGYGLVLGELGAGWHPLLHRLIERVSVCFFSFIPCLMEHRLLKQSDWVAVVRLRCSLDTGRVSSRKFLRMTHDCHQSTSYFPNGKLYLDLSCTT